MKSAHLLSIKFSEQRLVKDLEILMSDWERHFNTSYYDGEWSGIALREPIKKDHPLSAGFSNNTEYVNTSCLKSLTYIKEVLDVFKCKRASVRLLKLTAGSHIKEHKDPDLTYFDGEVRLHVPILTNNKVDFEVDGQRLKMKPGECWFADFSKPHSVKNNGNSDRIHLIIDLKVNNWLKLLFEEEGIIEIGEQKPNPIEAYSMDEKKQIISALLQIGSETSKEQASKLAKQFNLDLEGIS